MSSSIEGLRSVITQILKFANDLSSELTADLQLPLSELRKKHGDLKPETFDELADSYADIQAAGVAFLGIASDATPYMVLRDVYEWAESIDTGLMQVHGKAIDWPHNVKETFARKRA